jgi:NTE family protein
MLRALYERGVAPDLLVGTSAGALNAAFVAPRPQTPATAGELAHIWRGVQREDVFPVGARSLIAGITGQRDHPFPDRGLSQLVRRYLRIERLEDARIPLHLVTFDLLSARKSGSRAARPPTPYWLRQPFPACSRQSAGTTGSSLMAGSSTTRRSRTR